MGLLDYYRQFQGLSDFAVTEELKKQSAERRAKALEKVEPIDLSRTTWPGLPHPYVVNSITYAARKGLSQNTVRFHLKAVFAKTGAARQSDLIRLIADNPLLAAA